MKIFIGMLFLITSCHSEYVSLDYEVHDGAMWDNGHTRVAFIASKTATRSAKGVAAIPDGGIPDYLLENVGLYIFYIETRQLDQIVDFSDLANLIGPFRSNWQVKIVFLDSVILYHLQPAISWDWYLHQSVSAKDSLRVCALIEKFDKIYSFNIIKNETNVVDTTMFNILYPESLNLNRIDLTDLNRQLSMVPLSEWGLIVNNIYPKPDNDYIEETIYLKNRSSLTRRAVVEQIIAKLSSEEIGELLRKMDEYKNSLEGLKKMEFEIYSKETYNSIQDLL